MNRSPPSFLYMWIFPCLNTIFLKKSILSFFKLIWPSFWESVNHKCKGSCVSILSHWSVYIVISQHYTVLMTILCNKFWYQMEWFTFGFIDYLPWFSCFFFLNLIYFCSNLNYFLLSTLVWFFFVCVCVCVFKFSKMKDQGLRSFLIKHLQLYRIGFNK